MPEIDIASRFQNALQFGPGMLIFYLLTMIWITLLCVHRIKSINTPILGRFCFIICGLLIALGPALWIHFWTMEALIGLKSGPHDPYEQALYSLDAGIAASLVMATGVIATIISGFLVKQPNKNQGEAAPRNH